MKLPERFYQEKYIPTPEEITKYYIDLYPQGDVKNTIATIPYVLDAEVPYMTVEDNQPVTFAYIIEKYNKYLKWWNAKFGEKEPKFISKKDAKKAPDAFLFDKYYNRIFDIERTSRDSYILTNLKKETLERKHKLFIKLIKDAKEN